MKKTMVLAAVTLMASLTLTLGNAQATFNTDHYLSYAILPDLLGQALRRGLKPPRRPVVFLMDQFDKDGERRFRVGQPLVLYNPAIKNEESESLLNANDHLVGYKITETLGRHESQSVSVTNQFGVFSLQTAAPDRLLVPSAKSRKGPVKPLEVEKVDHFKCYPVIVGTKGSLDPSPVPSSVHIDEQFAAKDYRLLGPSRLCNPVKKIRRSRREEEITEIKNSADHLLCFSVEPLEEPDPRDIVEGISTNNQFGALRMVALEVEELCVPSSKEEESS